MLGLPILVLLAGSEAVFRLVVLPEVEKNNRADYDAFEKVCRDPDPALTKQILDVRPVPVWHPTIGFRAVAGINTQRIAVTGQPYQFHVNEEGARVATEADRGRNLRAAPIHVYGDSYTAGEDVQYADSWPAVLSEALGVEVANFGISGGAPDMALQYLLYNLTRGFRPRHVVIGMIPENASRLATRLYCQLYPRWMFLAFKPRFLETDGGLVWSPMPLMEFTDQNLAASYAKFAQEDYWGRRHGILGEIFDAKLGVLGLATYVLHMDMINDGAKDVRHSWYVRRVLKHILDQLADAGRTYGFTASFMLIPAHSGEVLVYNSGRDDDYVVFAQFLSRQASERGLTFIDSIAYAGRQSARLGPTFLGYDFPGQWVHASPLGNRVIAEAVHEKIAPLLARR